MRGPQTGHRFPARNSKPQFMRTSCPGMMQATAAPGSPEAHWLSHQCTIGVPAAVRLHIRATGR